MIGIKYYLANSSSEILSIFILLLIVLPGMIYYNQNNFSYEITSVSWSPDRSEIAFVRYKNSNFNFGEIMVWSKSQKSFQSIHYITDNNLNGGCAKYTFATCLPGDYFFNALHFSFSPSNKLLALTLNQGEDISFFIYNITSKKLIGTNDYYNYNYYPQPTINWINGSFWYAAPGALVNLLNNKTLPIYDAKYPINSPIVSSDGTKVAYTTESQMSYTNNNITQTQATYNIIIRNFQTNTILANISDGYSPIPKFWSSNSSELLYVEEYPTNLFTFNFSIYNVNSRRITYTFNSSLNQNFIAISPDFRYITILDTIENNNQGSSAPTYQNNYIRMDLETKTNSTFQNAYNTNPEVSLVSTSSYKVFNISTLPNLGTYYTHTFDNASEKNIGIGMTTVGIVIIVSILSMKNRRKIRQLFKKN